MPLFSVIIPAYNEEANITSCLQSVASQTSTDFEVILVDDGSTDNTKDIAKQWANDNPEVHLELYHQENKGLGAARNAGVKLAKGNWVTLLDADDLWEPNKLFLLKQEIQENPEAELIYHSVKTIGLGNSKVRKAFAVKSIDDILIKGNPIVPSATAIKRRLALAQPFIEVNDFAGAEDLDLWLRLLSKQYSLHYLNQPLTHYTEEGGMSTKLDEHLEKVNNVLLKAQKEGIISSDQLLQAQVRKQYEAARFLHKRGQFKNALTHYAHAHHSFKIKSLQFVAYLGIKL